MKRYAKWAGVALSGIVTILILDMIIPSSIRDLVINENLDVSMTTIELPTSSDSVEIGSHLVESVSRNAAHR